MERKAEAPVVNKTKKHVVKLNLNLNNLDFIFLILFVPGPSGGIAQRSA